MSQLISRILLTVLIFPATVLFYCVGFLLAERLVLRDNESAIVATAIVSSAFMLTYWWLLWRRTVRWTERRVGRTFAALAAAAAAGGAIGFTIYSVLPWEQWLGAFLGI